MYILSELKAPNVTRQSILVDLHNDRNPVLVLTKINRLEFHERRNDSIEYTKFLTKPIEKPTIAINKLYLKDIGEVLLVLDDSYTISIAYFKNEIIFFHEIIKLSSQGQQFSIDSNPMIVTDMSSPNKYFILHTFQGVLSLFILNDKYDFNKANTQRKRSRSRIEGDELFSITSKYIGSIVVLKMAILKNDILAVLYRDFNFSYSIRFYKIDIKEKSLTMLTSETPFEVPPTCLIPSPHGGVIVLSSVQLAYFPEDESFSSSFARPDTIITKDITDEGLVNGDVGLFVAYDIIDESRYILTTNVGISYILYLDIKKTHAAVQVQEFRLMKLGRTTIPNPNGLHRINGAYFYQSSQCLCDIIFRVDSNKPFINIVSATTEPQGPILDIIPKLNDPGFFTLMGNKNHTRIFNNISDSKYHFDFQSLCRTRKRMTRCIPVVGSKAFVAVDEDTECYLFGYMAGINYIMKFDFSGFLLSAKEVNNRQLFLTTVGLYNGKVLVYTDPKDMDDFIHSGDIYDGGILFISGKGELVYRKHSGRKFTYKFDCRSMLNALVSMSIGSHEKICLLSTSYGSISLISFKNEKFNIIDEWRLKNIGITSSALSYKDKTIYCFVITDEGYLIQYSIDSKRDRKLIVKYKIGPEWSFCEGLPDELFLKSSGKTCSLSFNYTVNHYVLTYFPEVESGFMNPIGGKTFILTSHEYDQLEHLELENEDTINDSKTLSHWHPNYFLKALTVQELMLLTLTKMDSIQGSPRMFLELYDTSNMKLLDKFEFDNTQTNGANVSDIILIRKKEADIDTVDLLAVTEKCGIFVIKIVNQKIEVESIKYPIGLTDELINNSDIRSISQGSVEEEFYLIGKMIIVLRYSNNIFETDVLPVPTPSIGILHSDKVFVDASQGLFEFRIDHFNSIDGKNHIKIEQRRSLDHRFLTALEISKDRRFSRSIYLGDAIGNFSEGLVEFNIGDQINCIRQILHSDKSNCFPFELIIGTLHGGIYVLSSVSKYDYDVFSKCWEELRKSSFYMGMAKRFKTSQTRDEGDEIIFHTSISESSAMGLFLKYYENHNLNSDDENNELVQEAKSMTKCVKNVNMLKELYLSAMTRDFSWEYDYECL
ncbi:uncharacterized protein RJT21DRAFT_117995 [Scheffersomyces amazonensis]|uniref:uncharacterized protein n=1 Tax=Scheffersomyces amazonensis TaxID=1078765 RepID=UPI00315CF8B2